MPLTRNQRHTKTSSPGPSGSAAPQAPAQPVERDEVPIDASSAATGVPNDQDRPPSPQAPRLRDRRSLASTKLFGTTVPSDYILNRQALKRSASTTPPIKNGSKRQCETAAPSASVSSSSLFKPSDQGDMPATSARVKSTERNEGTSILQKPPPRLDHRSKSSTSAQNIATNRLTSLVDGRRSDYSRAKTPTAEVPLLEKVIQSVRASLSSQHGSNPRIDLNDAACLPDRTKIVSPVRITLPNSTSKGYSLSNSSSWHKTPAGEPKQIEVVNLNSSLLRRSHPPNSDQSNSARDDALNLTISASTGEGLATVEDKIFNVLIAVTGSVAAIKLIELVKKLKSMFPQTYASRTDGKTYRARIGLKIVLTENSKHFLPSKDKIRAALQDPALEIHDDSNEWSCWKKIGDPVLHIELRKWADIMVIAPLDANTMAKIATGICDNLLTCIIRAWDTSKKLLYCPAMNVYMYEHPITREQLCKLQSFGYLRVDCIKKHLACGDVGMGAMASVQTICERVAENLLRPVSRPSIGDQTMLNKQPTYPIMSTNMEPTNSQKLLTRLNDKSGGSRQFIMSAVSGGRGPINANNQLGAAGLLGQPHLKNYLSSNNQASLRKSINSIKPTNGNGQTSNLKNHPLRSNFVTSLQNLQAINSDIATMVEPTGNGAGGSNDDDEDDNDIIDQSTPESCNSEWSYNGLDPTDVLEQSLIIDDNSLATNGFSANGSGLALQMNGSSVSDPGFTGLGRVERTPIFNTTKFLNICLDKERNCYTCAICKSDYKNRKSMARHLKEQHIQGNIFQCEPCGMSYKRREKLIKHNRERHGYDGIIQ